MKIEEIKQRFEIKKGQLPLTKFVDNFNNLSVELVDWPDPERLKKVFVNMSQSSWFEDFYTNANKEDVQEVIDDLLQGKILGQGLEHPQFCFRVSGIDLHITHALVRNRIGIAYLQRSLAVLDLRHEDIIVPRAYTKNLDLLKRYTHLSILGKQLYSDLLDTGEISNTDARISLLKSVPSWIYITCSLPTLLAIYGKRTDSQEEHVVLNRMSYMMRDLIVEKFDYMKSYFVSDDDRGRCLHLKKGYTANCIFARDEKHTIQGHTDEWTLHDKTKFELMENASPFQTQYFYGFTKVDEQFYLEKKQELANEKFN